MLVCTASILDIKRAIHKELFNYRTLRFLQAVRRMGGAVIVVTSHQHWKEQLEKARSEGKATVVDFFAEWCGPCKMIKPKYEEFSTQFPNVLFLTVDVDQVQAVAEECSISAMPTFHVYKDNAKVDEQVGASVEKLKALIAKYN